MIQEGGEEVSNIEGDDDVLGDEGVEGDEGVVGNENIEGDEGVETDVVDEDTEDVVEMAASITHATTGNFRMVCNTGSFVVVQSMHRGDVYLCTRCYIPYSPYSHIP